LFFGLAKKPSNAGPATIMNPIFQTIFLPLFFADERRRRPYWRGPSPRLRRPMVRRITADLCPLFFWQVLVEDARGATRWALPREYGGPRRVVIDRGLPRTLTRAWGPRGFFDGRKSVLSQHDAGRERFAGRLPLAPVLRPHNWLAESLPGGAFTTVGISQASTTSPASNGPARPSIGRRRVSPGAIYKPPGIGICPWVTGAE